MWWKALLGKSDKHLFVCVALYRTLIWNLSALLYFSCTNMSDLCTNMSDLCIHVKGGHNVAEAERKSLTFNTFDEVDVS